MGIIKNSITFGSGFNITAEGPIDSRMVVENIDDLTTVWGKDAPAYEGMMVSVLEDGNIYTLRNKDYSDFNNWKKQGSDSVNSGGDGSGIGKYSLPVMTKGMRDAALNDPSSGFTENSSYISVDVDDGGSDSDNDSSLIGETYNNTITSVNGSYLYIMMNTIRALQAEVAKLKNTFQYGIHSYNNEVTAKSSVLDQYDETLMDEPLWALDPSNMSEVFDTADFKSELLPENFTILGIGDESIDASIPNQLTFRNGTGKFSDKANTLFNLTDSKLVTYLVTDSKHIYFNLHTKDDTNHKRRVDIASFIEGDYRKYGIMFVLSRKVGEHGKNYVYVSVMNYDTNETIVEGYLTDADRLAFASGGGSTLYEVAYKYSIESIDFVEQTLYRMKFYTKYEDFSEEVIPSAPEDDYTYRAAHLTIRSVKNSDMMERIKEQLHENELIWNEDKKELNIKSNNKIYKIGIVGSNDNTNTEETMTPKELIEKLTQMGIIVNAKTDQDGNITSLDDLKLNDISSFSLVNSDTEKKYTFTVDPHGNLIGRDESMNTIEFNMSKFFEGKDYTEKVSTMNAFLDVVDDSNDSKRYGWVRGFTPFYLKALQGKDKLAPNGTSDYGLMSDRLRISSFYAPLKTDATHGCSHSFIELENTSDVDIPLEGVYLHFYKPLIDGDEDNSNKVYHLALDGVIKSGSTYLIRGAQHAEMDDESTFIKVNSYDKEWYYKKKDESGNLIDYGLVSFEQDIVTTKIVVGSDGKSGAVEDRDNNKVHGAYKFCLTYGLPELEANAVLIVENGYAKFGLSEDGEIKLDGNTYDKSTYPSIIKNRRYIDGCGFSSFSGFAAPAKYDADCKRKVGESEEVLCSGRWFCGGVTITENTMFRHMFALDPAKQAYNGWTTKDGSRTRYNKATDLQVVSLSKEYIGFPNSEEVVPISRYTPKASYENRNVMTDKSQLDREKPNMVTCSFGIDVYKTRCFNWISCGAFDEYLWVRKQGETNWSRFASYTKKNTPIVYSKQNNELKKIGTYISDNSDFYYINEGWKTWSYDNMPDGLKSLVTPDTPVKRQLFQKTLKAGELRIKVATRHHIYNTKNDSYTYTINCLGIDICDANQIKEDDETTWKDHVIYSDYHKYTSSVLGSDESSTTPDKIDVEYVLNVPSDGTYTICIAVDDTDDVLMNEENELRSELGVYGEIFESNANCFGYVGTFENINVNGDLNLIDTISTYIKSKEIDEPVWCRLLKFVNNEWRIVYQSKEPKIIKDVDLDTISLFEMGVKDDTNKYIKSTDKIAIVFVTDKNAPVLSSVELNFKIVNNTGSLQNSLTTNSVGVDNMCPLFVIGYKSMIFNEYSDKIYRKEFVDSVNNAVYARITNRFPGNNVLFTSHKVIINLPQIENDEPVVYEYVVGRSDKNNNPDPNHTNDIYTFTLYPSSYEGRTYHITDQQGFHWIEYQVWAATAEKLNQIITTECNRINNSEGSVKVFPILINTGDMTQSGARINEWLDYYNGGKCLFNHMEQMNCVGNNDLCNLDPTILGTGNDPGKSNAKFFHYFYCYEIPNDERLLVKAHYVTIKSGSSETKITIPEDRYIPSIYYFETNGVMYVVANSEVTKTTCEKWFGLYGKEVDGVTQSINLYTGIEIRADGDYNNYCQNKVDGSNSNFEPNRIFYPIYETIYSWLSDNAIYEDGVIVGSNKKIVFACHEIPFTVITQASLANFEKSTMGYTRNYPNGTSSLLGSHMNQLDATENRGTYWISRLLEYFGCKLCIGGHKHTYALSYPIKENYQWVDKDGAGHNSLDGIKEMKPTLEDESGENPENKLSWVVTTRYDANNNPYNVSAILSGDITISSTKVPYIPKDLYDAIGKFKFEGNLTYYRCCEPIVVSDNGKYNGFVNYAMCQATGYKLKSNKELPSAYQVFSKLIPKTDNVYEDGKFKDTVNENQLYPMYSVLEFVYNQNGEIEAIDVKLCRVAGIFKVNGKDSFTQTSYGTNAPTIQYLISVTDENVGVINNGMTKDNYMYGAWIPEGEYNTPGMEGKNKYLYIKY